MRVRRSPHLIAYWRRSTFVVTNYATRVTTSITPFICQLLDACESWQAPAALRRRLDIPADTSITALLERLVALNLLERQGAKADPRVQAMSKLEAWNPEAGFFHTATRDVRFASTREVARYTKARVAEQPMPATVKRYPRVTRHVTLPKPREGVFAEILRTRRTWRRFSAQPITVDDVATLLGLTSGIQQWVTSAGQTLALKTSPSGGARHSIETYAVVRDVAGLKAGVYHYAPDQHGLDRVRGPVTLQRMRDYLPNSGYFAAASVMVFFTVVFERILWRYPYSRAYRAALVEAGHLCQTFCLTATWLGLAPYCVMGLADSLIEQDLGIDGLTESVLYAAGVGRKPARASWAPAPRGTFPVTKNPRL